MENKIVKGGKMERKYMLGVIALAMIAVIGIAGVSAFGFGFNPSLTQEEKDQIQEQRQAIKQAIETEDFEAWQALMQETIVQMQNQITEENFEQLVEKHEQRPEIRQERPEFSEETEDSEFLPRKKKPSSFAKGYDLGFRRGFKMGLRLYGLEKGPTGESPVIELE